MAAREPLIQCAGDDDRVSVMTVPISTMKKSPLLHANGVPAIRPAVHRSLVVDVGATRREALNRCAPEPGRCPPTKPRSRVAGLDRRPL